MTEQYTHFAQAVYELRWILVMAGFALMALLWLEENVRRHDAQDKREADARRYRAELDTAWNKVDDLNAEVKGLKWQNRVLSIAVQSPRPSAFGRDAGGFAYPETPEQREVRRRSHLVALPAPDQKTGDQS